MQFIIKLKLMSVKYMIININKHNIMLQMYVECAAIALVVGWTHLRVGLVLKFAVMIASICTFLGIFSKCLIIQDYYTDPKNE
jgi:hypothetical protein